jgi:DNA-binding HxlR family transcriptional regulator
LGNPSRKSRFGWEDIKDFCETLTEAEDALTRDMVSRISDKWSLWTMSVIAQSGKPMRFSRIMEQVDGISQKSLTKTLRGLERDGLVTRKVFAEVPPRVEYTIQHSGPRCLTRSRRSGFGWQKAFRPFRITGRHSMGPTLERGKRTVNGWIYSNLSPPHSVTYSAPGNCW